MVKNFVKTLLYDALFLVYNGYMTTENIRRIQMEDMNIMDIFKAAFSTEIKNKVEIYKNKLVVYVKDNKKVVVEITKMFTL